MAGRDEFAGLEWGLLRLDGGGQALPCRWWGPCGVAPCAESAFPALRVSAAWRQHGQRQCVPGGLLRGHQQVSSGAPGMVSLLPRSPLHWEALPCLQAKHKHKLNTS